MKQLHFDYIMQIDYSTEVVDCYYTIKCIPGTNTRQQIEDLHIEMYPSSTVHHGVDGFGNEKIYGMVETPHRTFMLRIWGLAITGLQDYEEETEEASSMICSHPYGQNRAGKEIVAFRKRIRQEAGETYASLSVPEKAELLMHCLYKEMHYCPGSTDVRTTGEDAFSRRQGVCQDYTHIYLALLHLEGICARYATGFMIGEGASHAWAEVLVDHKWYGFDPTNNVRVTDDYIKLAAGRDASDCTINRGIVRGGGLHTQTVRVTVREQGENA